MMKVSVLSLSLLLSSFGSLGVGPISGCLSLGVEMGGLEKFFTGWFWAALTGTVTLLSAVVPVIVGMAKKVDQRREEVFGSARRPMRIGCGSVALSGTLNVVAYLLYGVLVNGFAFTFIGLSPRSLRTDYWAAVGSFYRLDSLWDTMTTGCGFMCLVSALLFSLFICSIVAALRYGYEYGVYGMVLGVSAIGFPVNLAMVSSIPAYVALPALSKLYIIAVSVFSSLLASLVVLAVTWFILRSTYQSDALPPSPMEN